MQTDLSLNGHRLRGSVEPRCSVHFEYKQWKHTFIKWL